MEGMTDSEFDDMVKAHVSLLGSRRVTDAPYAFANAVPIDGAF